MAVNSEFITTITPVHQERKPRMANAWSAKRNSHASFNVERVSSLAAAQSD
jgi:hypothetical protein